MFQFVIPKGQYKQGDEVLYFPIDALLPPWVVERLGLVGKLSGSEKNRIKTVQLRGEISQGIVSKPETILGVCAARPWATMTEEELTKLLEVIKYEPAPIPCHSGNLVGMPGDIPIYDIEGADNYPDVVEMLMDELVYVSEKVEGTNFWISINAEGKLEFGQRNHRIEPLQLGLWAAAKALLTNFLVRLGVVKRRIQKPKEHSFLRVARESRVIENLEFFAKANPGKRVTLRGEFAGPGVQGNIYGLKDNKIFLFDLLIDGRYQPAAEFFQDCFDGGLNAVPCIACNVTLREWLAGKSVREASNGMSEINPQVKREGIVIKPFHKELLHPRIGRLMIKQRSPEYLAESDN